MASSRTVVRRLVEGRVYPQVERYKFCETFTIERSPKGFNGPQGNPIDFRYTNPIDVAVYLLGKIGLHKNDDDNFCWGPEVVTNNKGEQIYTRDMNSGNWWRR